MPGLWIAQNFITLLKHHENTGQKKLINRSKCWAYTAVSELRLNSKNGIY